MDVQSPPPPPCGWACAAQTSAKATKSGGSMHCTEYTCTYRLSWTQKTSDNITHHSIMVFNVMHQMQLLLYMAVVALHCLSLTISALKDTK
jgi:hypothetical protein